jgi:Transcriptional regulator, AbiEi antitoxin
VLLTRKASERDNAASCARPPENPGLLRLKDFVAEGIGPETLARLVREEAVVRPARGLYQLPDAQVEASHTLAEAAVLVPKGGSLPDLSPPIPRTDTADAVGCMDGDRPLRLAAQDRLSPYLVCGLHWIGTDRRVEHHRIENVDVCITDPARTIVDCFRYRTKIGLDVAMEGLREGLRCRQCKPDQLWRYARKARVWSVMRPYVEAMVSDAA